jgi:hypothetical protein
MKKASLKDKLTELIQSRKFWSLLFAIASAWISVSLGIIPPAHAVYLTIAAFGIYTGAVSVENVATAISLLTATSNLIPLSPELKSIEQTAVQGSKEYIDTQAPPGDTPVPVQTP